MSYKRNDDKRGWMAASTVKKKLAKIEEKLDELNEVLILIYKITDDPDIEQLIEDNVTTTQGWTGGGE